MIAGDMRAPYVPTDNERIARRHMNSIALSAFFRHTYEAFGGLTVDRMLRAVEQTRQRGWSFLDSVATPGSAALGVSIPGEQAVAAISVAAISGRLPASRLDELAATIAHQAVQVADLMKAMRRIEPA